MAKENAGTYARGAYPGVLETLASAAGSVVGVSSSTFYKIVGPTTA